MNTMDFQSAAWLRSTDVSAWWQGLVKIRQGFRAILGATILAGLYPFAVADAACQRLVTTPTGSALAHARTAWLHRWSRIARRVLGLHLHQRGFTPVSGIVVANHTSLLDAILLAAVHPCVFVAGAEVRRWPIVGVLARLGGTLFVDCQRWNDTARVNFMIQRAVQRRLFVVIFPECGSSDGTTTLRAFASALFQPATEIGCTLTAAAISYRSERGYDSRTPAFAPNARFLNQVAHLLTRCRACAVIAFGGPTFHHGDRKHLARQLRGEVRALKFLAARRA
jgi:1-acyl-sn-glycerol-3-phosphate acyltransferase